MNPRPNGSAELSAASAALQSAESWQPVPARYVLAILPASAAGWLAFASAVHGGAVAGGLALLVLCSLSLYRSLAFVHELFHQQSLYRVRAIWHAVVAIPMLMPLLLYQPIHRAHHNRETYGTAADGEYEQFSGRFGTQAAKLLLLNFALPAALWIRFAVLTPLALISSRVERDVLPRAVHLAMRVPFVAPPASPRFRRENRIIEILCMLAAWAWAVPLWTGHATVTLSWALVVLLMATLNTMRALCSTHLYDEQPQGRDTAGQFADSLNVDGGGLLTWLLCPAGLQYHALHHLMPSLPFHALPEAHRRLLAEPGLRAYREASVPDMISGLRRVVASAKRERPWAQTAL